MTAISGTVTHGVTVAASGTYGSPLTVTDTGYIDNTGVGDAVFGPNTNPWTVVNYNRIVAHATDGNGIELTAGGTVINGKSAGAGAYIAAGSGATGSNSTTGYIGGIGGTGGKGVVLAGAGYVGNTGKIVGGGGGTGGKGTSALSNGYGGAGGRGGSGVELSAGDNIVNSGSIAGGGGGAGGVGYSAAANATGGTGGVGGVALVLAAGNSLSNSGTITGGAGGTGGGAVSDDLNGYGGKGGAGGTGVLLLSQASLSNTGAILAGSGGAGGASDTNGAQGASGTAVSLTAGGTVTNGDLGNSQALIQGRIGIAIQGNATVTNFGTIANTATDTGPGTFAVQFGATGSGAINNFGTIVSLLPSGGGAILLQAGGSIFNNSTGVIDGDAGNAIVVQNTSPAAAVIVSNDGTIRNASNNAAIYMQRAGLITNGQSGVISNGSGAAIAFKNIAGSGVSVGTVMNAGTIGGAGIGSGDGIYFGPAMTALVTNLGTVQAASGGQAGIDVKGGGTIVNGDTIDPDASIIGGAGVVDSHGSAGGAGIFFAGAGSVVNYGTVAGGQGGDSTSSPSTPAGGTGGSGVDLRSGGNIVNAGSIAGGQGGLGGSGNFFYSGGVGGTGGSGVAAMGGNLINTGGIIGGAGGTGGYGTESAGIGGTGGTGVSVSGGGRIDNAGSIVGGIGGLGGHKYHSGVFGGTGGTGVVLSNGGTVDNTGTIEGGAGGSGTPGYSYGKTGQEGGAIVVTGGGVINNGSTDSTAALIRGRTGILATGGAVTITNHATIYGRYTGIGLGAGGTVTNSGTISGGDGTAVSFGAGSGDNLLVLTNGYRLIGGVFGSSDVGATNRVLLSGSAGAAVSADYNALGLNNFGTVGLADGIGDYATLRITNTAILPKLIVGFDGPHETIDLTAIGINGHITNVDNLNHRVTITGSLGTATLQFDAAANLASFTTHSDGAGGSNLMVACFCRGTLILTEAGEVTVEQLAIGDRVVTLSGEAQPIRWIGRCAYDGRFVGGNRNVLPICVMAGALKEDVPIRNLWLSPEHSLYIDDLLVQTKHLINGRTVVQPDSVDEVEYFHIELDSHAVIYADGMPAETFADCDNRLLFINGHAYASLYPEDTRPRWQFCAQRLEWGSPELVAIREWMFDRSLTLGYLPDPSPESDRGVHLVIDGERQSPLSASGSTYRFEIPGNCREVRLGSHSIAPAEHDAVSRDSRRLGLPLERIVLSDADLSLEAWHSHPAFRDGFHADETSHRWTHGNARIPDALLRPFPGPITLEVRLAIDLEQVAQGARSVN